MHANSPKLSLRSRTAGTTVSGRRTSPLCAAIVLLLATAPALPLAAAPGAGAAITPATELASVLVIGPADRRVRSAATELDLSVRETPQAISVVLSGQMRPFGADSVNDARRPDTGVRVDEWEANRTGYSARG